MFVTTDLVPTSPFLAALLTEPQNPTPVGWSGGAPLTYVFDNSGARAWSAAEQAAVAQAFAAYSEVIPLDFAPAESVADTDFIFALIESRAILGEATTPADGRHPIQLRFSVTDGVFDTIAPGGYAHLTLLHEIGHALGLYHPHDGILFPGVPEGGSRTLGTDGQNQTIWTVMSCVDGWIEEPLLADLSLGLPKGPMAFDIAALQALYGERPAANGRHRLHPAPDQHERHGLDRDLGHGRGVVSRSWWKFEGGVISG